MDVCYGHRSGDNDMQDDLIYRQAAIAEFSCCELTPDGGIDVNYAIDFLEGMPSAQAERKTGQWTKAYDGNDDHVKCTGCFKTYDWISQAQYYNYCPNCGAYMRGDTE